MITSEGVYSTIVIRKFKVGRLIKYAWPGKVILKKSCRKIRKN